MPPLFSGVTSIRDESAPYIPLVNVRIILTGFSSLISSISRFPEKAAAWASAARDRDEDFGSRRPPRSACSTIRPSARLPVDLSRRTVFAVSGDEIPLFPRDFEGNHPFEERFISLAKIPFVIAASFFTANSSTHPAHADCNREPSELCDHLWGVSNGNRSIIQAELKLVGFRERLQRSCLS